MLDNYYMFVVEENDQILHLKRNPTWKSVVLFIILWIIVHFLSLQSPYPYVGYLCYALGLWFCYLSTEKFEECIFDKRKNTVTMMNARVLQKYTIGYNRKIVSELKEVIGVTTQSVKPTILGTAHQVVLIYVTGLTLSITASAVYCEKKLHKQVESKINKFLKLAESPFDNDEANGVDVNISRSKTKKTN